MRRIGERPVAEIIEQRSESTTSLKRPLGENELSIILRAGRSATSRYNLQPWRFLVVRDFEARRRLAEICTNDPQLVKCDALIVIFATSDSADTGYRQKIWNAEKSWIRDHVVSTLDSEIESYKPEFTAEWAATDAAIAIGQMIFACESLGYPAAVFDSFDEGKLKDLVGAPPTVSVVGVLGLGGRKSRDFLLSHRTPLNEVVFSERWEMPFAINPTSTRPFVYSQSIVTYFDILGFRQMVNSWDADRIGTALQTLSGLSRPDPQIIDLYDLAFFSFSDHIVRVAGIQSDQDSHDSDGLLFSELMELAIIQVNLLRAGVLVRGCVTVGEIVAERGVVFGPALVRAYEIENGVASYPRIVVDPKIIEAVEAGSAISRHAPEEEKAYLRDLVWNGSDGICFVNYLGMVDSAAEAIDVLRLHKSLIESQLRDQSELNGITAKYNWLIGYHNAAVRNLSDETLLDLKVGRESLLISTGELPSWGEISSQYPLDSTELQQSE